MFPYGPRLSTRPDHTLPPAPVRGKGFKAPWRTVLRRLTRPTIDPEAILRIVNGSSPSPAGSRPEKNRCARGAHVITEGHADDRDS